MTDYRVIIAGSRSFNDYELLREQCLSILQEKMRTHRVIIVSGHARGADSLGERFANEFRLPFELHPAKWRLLGRQLAWSGMQRWLNVLTLSLLFGMEKAVEPDT